MPHYLSTNPSLEKLLTLKRKILDNSFQYSPEDYYLLSQEIFKKKCSTYATSTGSKKEYFRLLHHGGTAGAALYSESTALHRAYREIETAEKELITQKPKLELLLPQDGKKLLNTLRADPLERGRVEKWYLTLDKIK